MLSLKKIFFQAIYPFLILTYFSFSQAMETENIEEEFSATRGEIEQALKNEQPVTEFIIRYLNLWPQVSDVSQEKDLHENLLDVYFSAAIIEQSYKLRRQQASDELESTKTKCFLGELYAYRAVLHHKKDPENRDIIAHYLQQANSFLEPLARSDYTGNDEIETICNKARAICYNYYLAYIHPDERAERANLFLLGKKAQPSLNETALFEYSYLKEEKGSEEEFSW